MPPTSTTSTATVLPQLGSVAQQSGKWAAANIARHLDGHDRRPFEYEDKGIMAMIGRNAAIAELGKNRHEIDGPFAFAAWLGVHATLLEGTRQKLGALMTWGWDYASKRAADRARRPPRRLSDRLGRRRRRLERSRVMEPKEQVTKRRAVLGGVIGFVVIFVIITVAAIALGVGGGLAVFLGIVIGALRSRARRRGRSGRQSRRARVGPTDGRRHAEHRHRPRGIHIARGSARWCWPRSRSCSLLLGACSSESSPSSTPESLAPADPSSGSNCPFTGTTDATSGPGLESGATISKVIAGQVRMHRQRHRLVRHRPSGLDGRVPGRTVRRRQDRPGGDAARSGHPRRHLQGHHRREPPRRNDTGDRRPDRPRLRPGGHRHLGTVGLARVDHLAPPEDAVHDIELAGARRLRPRDRLNQHHHSQEGLAMPSHDGDEQTTVWGPEGNSGRLGAGAIASLTGIGLLVLFMLQNRDKVPFDFLWWSFNWPLWLIVLTSALIGALVWFGLGVIRRHNRRKERREDRRS